MTIQQLEYIVAIDKYRHFVKASEACGVTQPTLSSMIQKLEAELDTVIFDRNSHPICPTLQGERIIDQAKVVLYNTRQLKEMALSEREQESGDLRLGVIPTVAPYIIPQLFHEVHVSYPRVRLHISEARTAVIIEKLHRAELDVALLATPLDDNNLLEIPVYYEKFVAYVSPNEPLFQEETIASEHMPTDKLWILQEGHCMRNQVMNFCERLSGYSSIYEAGSISTLVKIVDVNGGYTIIPELHLPLLDENQHKNLRSFTEPYPIREISLVVRKDYVRERLLNILAECIRRIIPEHMVDNRLKKYAIRL